MRCPECNGKTRVYRSEPVGEEVERYRACKMCGHRWKTYGPVEGVEVKPQARTLAALPLFAGSDEE